MDTVFSDEIARANFLQSVMQTFGCTYICLWSYYQQSNCLLFSDGCYHEENNQPISSSGSLARRFFDDYCQSVIIPVVEYDRVPGLAFKNGQEYVELNESELQRLAYTESQRLFYQEARIKTAVFMACNTGEIELGFSGMTPINMDKEIRNLFQKDLSSQLSPVSHELATGRPSSSSSSLRSLSIDSPTEYSNSLLFNIPTTSHIPETTLKDVPPMQPLIPSTTSPTQQAMQAFAQLQNVQLPTQETEQAVMTRAILAVLTSSSSSTSSSQAQVRLPPRYSAVSPRSSAFKNYNLALAPTTSQMRSTSASTSLRAQSMLKRAISYYTRLNTARRQYMVANRPTSTQLHHMISERKRREKLNESFQALRSLLPPGTKKDKASLLISTREYLNSLKAQVDELRRRNQILEAQLLPGAKAAANEEASASSSSSSNERVEVTVTPVPESTSEWRIIDLGVTVRGECCTLDIVTSILEFLKQVQNVSLMSMETNTQISESSSSNHVILRLRIEGNEWEESAFKEAVRRVVASMVTSDNNK
ncbi:Basic helix-loop-helix transcription factor [Melia azedarach]|uniref:Basic helix-loop-helix transcription factor n=1 Tax=Melia azedarach TaxID=155640 RepID=A0ACC1XBU2_MELAZ|nr:Basic helix-loop-helix transcription factor [Melia azedarach]